MTSNKACRGTCFQQIRMDQYEKDPKAEWCDCTLQECSACHVEHPEWYFNNTSMCRICIYEIVMADHQTTYKEGRKQRAQAFFNSKKRRF